MDNHTNQRDAVGRKDVGLETIHSKHTRKASFAHTFAAAVLERLGHVGVAQQRSVSVGVEDQVFWHRVALDYNGAACADTGKRHVGDGGRERSGSKVHRGEVSEDVLQHQLGEGLGLLTGEVHQDSGRLVGGLNVGDVGGDITMVIQVNRDAVDRSAASFVRTAGVSRVGEGRGGQSLNARHDDSGTFLRSRAGIRAAERGERLERSNEGLQGFLKED